MGSVRFDSVRSQNFKCNFDSVQLGFKFLRIVSVLLPKNIDRSHLWLPCGIIQSDSLSFIINQEQLFFVLFDTVFVLIDQRAELSGA